MISFIRRRTATVLAFVFVTLSTLLYQVPVLNSALRILSQEMADSGQDDASKASNVYGFKVKDIDGNEVDMNRYRWVFYCYYSTFLICFFYLPFLIFF